MRRSTECLTRSVVNTEIRRRVGGERRVTFLTRTYAPVIRPNRSGGRTSYRKHGRVPVLFAHRRSKNEMEPRRVDSDYKNTTIILDGMRPCVVQTKTEQSEIFDKRTRLFVHDSCSSHLLPRARLPFNYHAAYIRDPCADNIFSTGHLEHCSSYNIRHRIAVPHPRTTGARYYYDNITRFSIFVRPEKKPTLAPSA